MGRWGRACGRHGSYPSGGALRTQQLAEPRPGSLLGTSEKQVRGARLSDWASEVPEQTLMGEAAGGWREAQEAGRGTGRSGPGQFPDESCPLPSPPLASAGEAAPGGRGRAEGQGCRTGARHSAPRGGRGGNAGGGT